MDKNDSPFPSPGVTYLVLTPSTVTKREPCSIAPVSRKIFPENSRERTRPTAMITTSTAQQIPGTTPTLFSKSGFFLQEAPTLSASFRRILPCAASPVKTPTGRPAIPSSAHEFQYPLETGLLLEDL